MLHVARTTAQLSDSLSRQNDISHYKSMATPAGPIFLQDHCPPALVESLRADSGLRAFARLPQREHALLLGLAQRSYSRLALAYTHSREIIGQITLAPVNDWLDGIKNTNKNAIEISSLL